METFYFEKQYKASQRADHWKSVLKPDDVPCLKLVFNNDWNDYGFHTWYVLWYIDKKSDYHYIGNVKLMHEDGDAYEYLDGQFKSLDESFCSVGLDTDYYYNLMKLFHEADVVDILTSLRDCSINRLVYDKFKDTDCFKNSLLRDISTEQALREGPNIVKMKDPSEAYSFEYTYIPNEDSEIYTTFNCHLEYPCKFYKRSFALIGENGVGKTHMLTGLVRDLVFQNKERFNKIPLLQRCFIICSSRYDEYYKIYEDAGNRTAKLPFSICHVVQDADAKKRIQNLIFDILKRGTLLTEKGMMVMPQLFEDALKKQLPEQLIDGLLSKEKVETEEGEYDHWQLNSRKLEKLIDIFSTGQLQIFSLTVNLFAKLEPGTLVVIDEPEVHLHTTLIQNFICMLNDYLSDFKSYAIIATHSPLVVREVVRHNVFLMRKVEGNIPLISEAHFETFGNDLSDLYRYIFGYDEQTSYFHHVIEHLARKYKSYDKVTEELKKNGVAMNLNSRFEIQEILNDLGYEESDTTSD